MAMGNNNDNNTWTSLKKKKQHDHEQALKWGLSNIQSTVAKLGN